MVRLGSWGSRDLQKKDGYLKTEAGKGVPQP